MKVIGVIPLIQNTTVLARLGVIDNVEWVR